MTAGRKTITDNKEWGTPEKYVKVVKDFFGGEIDLDPCSNKYSIVGAKVEYRLPNQDGLKESWNFPKIYVNPPYGSDKDRGTKIYNWIEKCKEAHFNYNSEVLALVPVATNTKHWKDNIFGIAKGVCFLSDTRLKFLENGKEGGNGSPMACSMVYWGNNYNQFKNIFSQFGNCVQL